MTVQECKRRHTHKEYIEWLAYWEMEANAFNPDRYYMAQVAAEVRRGNSKKPLSVKTEQLLIKFETKGGPPKRMTKAEVESQKAAWGAIVGGVKKP
ncbi:MAG: hypothetical protein GY841_02705 [FCB group bacterium]|nr:hypothetical protein [FCB group bacterium]